jgi:hypothetical protein
MLALQVLLLSNICWTNYYCVIELQREQSGGQANWRSQVQIPVVTKWKKNRIKNDFKWNGGIIRQPSKAASKKNKEKNSIMSIKL